jgi:hypothetical protein
VGARGRGLRAAEPPGAGGTPGAARKPWRCQPRPQPGRLPPPRQQLAQARARGAELEAALQSLRAEADREKRRAEHALADCQREAERRLASEQRAAQAEDERREDASKAAAAAASAAELRRALREAGEGTERLQGELSEARREARAAAEDAAREREAAGAERGRWQQELANERAKVAAGEDTAARWGARGGGGGGWAGGAGLGRPRPVWEGGRLACGRQRHLVHGPTAPQPTPPQARQVAALR